VFDFLRRRRHARIAKQPFPEAYSEYLRARVPYAARLDGAALEKLHDLILVFLEEKSFDGAGGLELTDEMRVVVAAQACILLLGWDEPEVYPDLARVVVYPSAYKATRKAMNGAVLQESDEVRLGESWDRGVVVLAWSAVTSGAADVKDGHNVVFHELAHQLDQQFGDADGAPELHDGMSYREWSTTLGSEFANLEAKAEDGRPTLLDHYGATNPAEFFAVATETFFEKPQQMKTRKPELYAQLAAFYRQDPATVLDRHLREEAAAAPATPSGSKKRAKR